MSIYKVERLDWDTNFFGKEIGKITLEDEFSDDELPSVLESAAGFDLTYIFTHSPLHPSLLHDHLFLADEKLDFVKNISSTDSEDSQTHAYDELIESDYSEELRELALLSGTESRFNLDPFLPSEKFNALYTQWLIHSLRKELADHCLAIKAQNKIQGFITLAHHSAHSRIGLLAVNPQAQGLGIGKKLVTAAEDLSLKKGTTDLYVATQGRNTDACRFYEKVGFRINERIYIYHFWNKP